MKSTNFYSSLWLLSLLALTLVGAVHADIPGRALPDGAVPNPGTQQQELANLTFPAPFNTFEFTVTCGACHGGTVDQQTAHMGNWGGGNMASAARDPVFRANQIIVNNTLSNLTGQDGAGNMCFRCHSPNGWYSGRFDPTKAGDPQGRTMLHSIVASTDDEGVMCETCHRAVGNVTYKRADLDIYDAVWNMIAGIPEVDMEVIGMPTGNDPRVFPGMLSNRDSMYDRAKRNTEITLRDALDVVITQEPLPLTDVNGNPLLDVNGNAIYEMKVMVVNQSGHRIPSGYPDGRRFWLEVRVNDGATIVYESGYYDPDQAKLFTNSDRVGFDRALSNVIDGTDPNQNAVMVYERVTGSCGGTCQPSTTLASSPSLLNDTILFDNRIPPAGFTYADYRMAGVKFWKYDPATFVPVEDATVDPVTGAITEQRYPDGQNWDEITYRFAAPANAVLNSQAEVYWQSHTREFMEHLKDQDNSTVRPEGPPDILALNYPMTPTYLSDVIGLASMTDLDGNPLRDNWGGIAYAAWLKSGMGEPYMVDRDDSTSVLPVTQPVVSVVPYSYTSPVSGARVSEPFTADISWSEVPEADGYVVWIRYGQSDATADWDRLAVTDNNTLTLHNTAMKVGKTYGFRVEAFNGKGSVMSDPVAYTTVDDAPKAPQNLQLVAVTPVSAQLSWYDMADNESQFEIWRFDVPVTTTIPQAAFMIPTQTGGPLGFGGNIWTDTSVEAGACYNYQVRAIGASGAFSTWNAPAPVEACIPAGTITATAAAPSEFQVDLSWSSTFPAASIGGFRVERSGMVNGPWSSLGVTANDIASYSDNSVMPSTTYYYRVMVVSTAGTDLVVSAPTAVTTPAPQLPLAPSGLTATVSSTGGVQVVLDWIDNATTETSFMVERATGTGPWIAINTSLPAGAGTGPMSYTDTTVSANTTYNYRVTAVNAAGTAVSNTTTVTTPNNAVVVDAPTNLTATLRSATQVRLRWKNAATNATGFVIERSTNGGAFVVLSNRRGTRRTSYRDRSVAAGNTYQYQVRAVRLAGGVTVQSDPSNVVEIATLPPMAPTALTASAATTGGRRPRVSVTLNWTNADSSATSVSIQNSADNGLTWNNVANVNVNGATGTYTQVSRRRRRGGNLMAGTTYSYRIQAINAIGVSAWSSEVVVTTP